MENYTEIISLREASKISGYSQDYLSYLIRTGKLKGHKLGRNWCTTKKEVDYYMSTMNFSSATSIISTLFGLKRILIAGVLLIVVVAGIAFYFLSVPIEESTPKTNTLPSSIDTDLQFRQ